MSVMAFFLKLVHWSVSLLWKFCLRFLEEVARASCVGLGVVNLGLLSWWQRALFAFLALGVQFSYSKLCGVASFYCAGSSCWDGFTSHFPLQ